MKNVGSKITNQVDEISISRQEVIDNKINEYLMRRCDIQLHDELEEQIDDQMPCIPVIRYLLRKKIKHEKR